MSKKIFLILLILLLISFSSQECKSHINNCAQCHPVTNLCVICEKSVYKPDKNGGCGFSNKCKIGENYCNECNNEGNLCSKCELGYFADKNGGCSSTDNCLISENGKCLECKDDFYLIKENSNFCKYKFSDDFRNCAEINIFTGKCNSCKENFYLTSDDNKCIDTNSCKKSIFGICILCDTGYFLDKNDNLCKIITTEFNNCKMSLNGKICSECNDGYFLSEDNICTKSPNCAKVGNFSKCIECSNGYFLSKYGNICTMEEHCQIANSQFGICEFCDESFYIELETRKCFSNKEDEKFKFCVEVKYGNCIMCDYEYELSKDNKCVSSLNCLKSENGICIKCEDGYHLGLDNRCINIENCIYSNKQGKCIECKNDYYFNSNKKLCLQAINQYKNCKKTSSNEYCEECKDNFYLSVPDKICYNNTEDNIFYKCSISTDNGTECLYCINNYFIGIKDLKCSKIEGCAISENENKCIECDEYLCLDLKKQICIDNYISPENDEKKIYFNCNKTNDEGTECKICNNYSELINGICVNKIECAEEKNGECLKCNEKNYDYYNMCLNNIYGCVETSTINCLRCDNIYNFNECTECMEGYKLNNGYCYINE